MSQLVRLEGKHTTQNAHCAVLTNNQNNEQIHFLANPFVQCGFLLVSPIFRTEKENDLQPVHV